MENQPNIVNVKEIFHERGFLFMVFECMEGNLSQLMKQQQDEPFSETKIRDMCFQLFIGLAYMHGKGYFHRDLKPDNILVNKDVIKIGDLGSAREMNDCAYTDYVTTRWYRAPEALLGSQMYDYAIDMWAMGAIMAELFTLKPLFQGNSEAAMMYKICSVLGTPTESTWLGGLYLAGMINYRFPEMHGIQFSDILPSASPDLVNLVSGLLSWNPCKRPAAMEALQHPFFHGCYHVSRPLFLKPESEDVTEDMYQVLLQHPFEISTNNVMHFLPEHPFEDSTQDMIQIFPEYPFVF